MRRLLWVALAYFWLLYVILMPELQRYAIRGGNHGLAAVIETLNDVFVAAVTAVMVLAWARLYRALRTSSPSTSSNKQTTR